MSFPTGLVACTLTNCPGVSYFFLQQQAIPFFSKVGTSMTVETPET